MSENVISAPGKVLLAGGYLVLDRAHTGLVFGLTARIYVHIRAGSHLADQDRCLINVKSPQFTNAEWKYECEQSAEHDGIHLRQRESSSSTSISKNQFVETALAFALSYIVVVSSTKLTPAAITILADRDYYSNPGIGNSRGRFLDFGIPLTSAHKTGLGSSAALVTAVTVAVLSHYLSPTEVSIHSEQGRACLHNLAQAAHCAAQGKIGSGFDVAAAVHGSCVYKRFSPSLLEDLGEFGSPGFAQRLKSLVNEESQSKRWDTVIDKANAIMPRGLKLLMCDVDCGSESVGMAKLVLKWRNEHPEEASLLWATLQRGTNDLAQELQRLTLSQSRVEYENLSNIILTIRSLVREMSVKAGVPIEPETQTNLLDACCRLPGVIGGVVPGAGGYDAVALIVEDQKVQENTVTSSSSSNPFVLQQLQEFLNHYQIEAKGEHGAGFGRVRLLNVQQESHGIKMESLSVCDGWVA